MESSFEIQRVSFLNKVFEQNKFGKGIKLEGLRND
jgi:hypothetical protein